MTEYRRYHNQVQRAAWRLRRNYYQNKLQNLRQSESRRWWQSVKGYLDSHQLTLAANSLDWPVVLLKETSLSLLRTLILSFTAFLQTYHCDFNCIAQLLPDIDVLPADLVTEPHSIENKLAHINVHKSPGPDQIPNWFLRDFSAYLADPVCCIFNTSFRTGIFPLLWKQANIIPVSKVQPPGSIESDIRPISLTPTLSKLLETYRRLIAVSAYVHFLAFLTFLYGSNRFFTLYNMETK